MNVILRSKVEGLGQRGDIVDVAQGHAICLISKLDGL